MLWPKQLEAGFLLHQRFALALEGFEGIWDSLKVSLVWGDRIVAAMLLVFSLPNRYYFFPHLGNSLKTWEKNAWVWVLYGSLYDL